MKNIKGFYYFQFNFKQYTQMANSRRIVMAIFIWFDIFGTRLWLYPVRLKGRILPIMNATYSYMQHG